MGEGKIDERDYFDLDDTEAWAVSRIRKIYDIHGRIDLVWEDRIRMDTSLYKVWKRETKRLEFKVAKQKLKIAYISTIEEILNTPWYEFPWYNKIIFAPLFFGLKGVNYVFQKIAKFMGGDLCQ